jgi:hypothetical protein
VIVGLTGFVVELLLCRPQTQTNRETEVKEVRETKMERRRREEGTFMRLKPSRSSSPKD